jgi:hypothetical protein
MTASPSPQKNRHIFLAKQKARYLAAFLKIQENADFEPCWNMKFSTMRQILTIILWAAVHLPAAWAQGNRDFMRETGKINVVVGVILLIFLGIVWQLVRLHRSLTKIEHQLNDDKHEWKN